MNRLINAYLNKDIEFTDQKNNLYTMELYTYKIVENHRYWNFYKDLSLQTDEEYDYEVDLK
jgi:hypothetical protein